MDDTQIIDALRSGDLERQAPALDEAPRVARALVPESVRALAGTELRGIAARLHHRCEIFRRFRPIMERQSQFSR